MPTALGRVVSIDVAVTDLESSADLLLAWSAEARGRYVCAVNVHMTMEAHDSADFRQVVAGSALAVPDGAPIVWALRLLGHRRATRVFGPDLMEALLHRAALRGVPVGLYGGTDGSLATFTAAAARRWPGLRVAVAIAPPFRPLGPEEDAEVVARIAASGARLLFVGLGCPKQERWMAEHAPRLPCLMVGVGQAFDLLAGVTRRPPEWMHRAGLGWLHRLAHEPRRLWRRYLWNNPRFVALLALQWARGALSRGSGAAPG
ncbi:MAG: WecB/TagA/CpsF family glycosyltransferase [Deltaproteobacteria bacterium]|nr:WecB/TagA/CpsF family glycosyltransferase [Deltaproteobacteria bacterium]